jgi:immune inhibitor A
MNAYEPTPAPPARSSRKRAWLIGLSLFALFLCLGCVTIAGAGYLFWTEYEETLNSRFEFLETTRDGRRVEEWADEDEKQDASPTLPPTVSADDAGGSSPTAVPTKTTPLTDAEPNADSGLLDLSSMLPAEIEQQPIPPLAFNNLDKLMRTDYPSNDYFAIAERLGNKNLGSRTVQGALYQLGDRQNFYVDDNQISAALVAMTENVQFWVEDGLDLDSGLVQEAADRFQNEYYLPLQELYGTHWDPGIDNIPQITFLHIAESGGTELGFFVSDNQYPRTLFQRSNEQEMVYMNMGELRLGSDLYYATLVHEYQHLVHWYIDPSESLWMNEGLSQLAEIYVGYDDTAGTSDYLRNPEVQLNSWNYEDDYVMAHYAAGYLFAVYMWEQLGTEAIQALARHPANGLAAVDAILAEYAPERPLTSFLSDWAAANYLDLPDPGTPYGYDNLNLRQVTFIDELAQKEDLDATYRLNQFGVHYFDLTDKRGPITLRFAGDTVAQLTAAPPSSGDFYWFAPAVDETNARLTASFDLTRLERASLRYSVWYDLESDYDYAYVSISIDGGSNWETLLPNHFSSGEFGPSYNGKSANRAEASETGWLKENVSLNQYVGNVVQIRFEVLTDSGITEQGFAIDDISIPEYNYATNVDEEAGDWLAEGFVRTGWQLPQQWSVQWISEGPSPVVEKLTLDNLNQGEWELDAGKGGGVLVVMPQTPFIFSPADYWLQITTP